MTCCRCALVHALQARSRGAPCRDRPFHTADPPGRSDGDFAGIVPAESTFDKRLERPPVPRLARQLWVAITSLSLLAGGCAPRQPFYFFEDGDLSHYVGAIQKLEYPDKIGRAHV